MMQTAYDFKDLLVKPCVKSPVNSRKDVDCTSKRFKGVPIIAANMYGVGNFRAGAAFAKHKIYTCIQKQYTVTDWENALDEDTLGPKFDLTLDAPFLIPCTGASTEELEKVIEILSIFPDTVEYVCLDVANGHASDNINAVIKLREMMNENFLEDVKIIYGNVANPDVLDIPEFRDAIDYIKIGIGSGSVCTTRLKTSVGVPQATLLDSFVTKTHTLDADIGIISDGGCRNPGHVAMAFIMGADAVMLGGMLATTREGHDGAHIGDPVQFSGNSSGKNNEYDFYKRYRTAEGKSVKLYIQGSVDDHVQDILGGIRSACTYVGVDKITDLPLARGSVMIVNRQADNYY